MGGWVKLALGVLVAALVAVLIVSFTASDDSTSPSTSSVADGQPKGSADTKSDAGQSAPKGSKKDAADGGASSAVPAEEGGFTESSGGDESSGSNDSGGRNSNGTKVGGLGDASDGSGKVGKAKKKKTKAASKAPGLDPEAAAASAVLEAYMAARGTQNWPTACAQMTPKAIASLERFAGVGRGCVATFAAFYPHLAPGSWDNTMTGPITTLRADGFAIYHGTTGRDYGMPMVKEGGGWKVAAVGPIAVS